MLIEKTIAEVQQEGRLLFREMPSSDAWMGFSILLIVLAFFTESYFRMTDDTLHVQLGGIVSWCGVLGLVSLLYDGWRRRKTVTAGLTDEDVQFLEFTADGLVYGVRGSWSKSVAWPLINKVRLTHRHALFSMPHTEVQLNFAHLDAGQRQELESFLAARRSRIEPHGFFGFTFGNAGRTFGPEADWQGTSTGVQSTERTTSDDIDNQKE